MSSASKAPSTGRRTHETKHNHAKSRAKWPSQRGASKFDERTAIVRGALKYEGRPRRWLQGSDEFERRGHSTIAARDGLKRVGNKTNPTGSSDCWPAIRKGFDVWQIICALTRVTGGYAVHSVFAVMGWH